MADGPGKSRLPQSQDDLPPEIDSGTFSTIIEADEDASPETTERRVRAAGGYGT